MMKTTMPRKRIVTMRKMGPMEILRPAKPRRLLKSPFHQLHEYYLKRSYPTSSNQSPSTLIVTKTSNLTAQRRSNGRDHHCQTLMVQALWSTQQALTSIASNSSARATKISIARSISTAMTTQNACSSVQHSLQSSIPKKTTGPR